MTDLEFQTRIARKQKEKEEAYRKQTESYYALGLTDKDIRDAIEIASWFSDACADMAWEQSGCNQKQSTQNMDRSEMLADDLYNELDLAGDLLGDRLCDRFGFTNLRNAASRVVADNLSHINGLYERLTKE